MRRVIPCGGDGLRDDWEKFHFGSLSETASGDADGDGINNGDEQASDGDPKRACPLMDGQRVVLVSQRSPERVVTLSGSGAVLATNTRAPAQQWSVRYVGAGFFQLASVVSGELLGMPSADVASGIPVQVASATEELRQQWRVTTSPGAEPNFYALANRETGRVLDGVAGDEGEILKQYPLLGEIPQQFFRVDALDTELSDAGSEADGSGSAMERDAAIVDGGSPAFADASAPTDIVSTDAGASSPRDGSPSTPDEPSAHGCSLGGSSAGSGALPAWLIVAVSFARRRRRLASSP